MKKVIIDVEKLKEEVNDYKCKHPIYAEQQKTNELIDLFINIIDSYADEGEEIKTAKWKDGIICTNCWHTPYSSSCERTEYSYCPFCGAHMKEV